MKARYLLLLSSILVVNSCKPRQDSNENVSTTSSSDQKVSDFWLNKVGRHFYSQSYVKANFERLHRLSKEEVVNELMQQPGFEQVAIELTLYYLGFLSDSTITEIEQLLNGSLKQIPSFASQYPQVLVAAHQLVNDSNYLTIYRDSQPVLDFPKSPSRFGRQKSVRLKDYVVQSRQVPTFSDEGFWQKIPNTPTNFHRKRGKYILKTYFCDDLTPIDISVLKMKSEAGNEHLLPACHACHYKLDPIAGFFKDYEIERNSIGTMTTIRFENNQRIDDQNYIKKYLSAWNQGEKLNVGFIRSATDRNQNIYGQNLADFFKILQAAPEVRQCMVKRIYEFFLGREQSYDGQWLKGIAQEFVKDTDANVNTSAVATKKLIKTMLLSNVYGHENPVAQKCYDPEESQDSQCRIRFLLNEHCSSCHSTKNASSDLDLSQWVKGKDGKYNFRHFEERDQQRVALTAQETFSKLKQVITDRSMPKDKSIPESERVELYKWILEYLEQIKTVE